MVTTLLPVRRRRTIDERGASRVELFVDCPSHETPRGTSACLSCGFGDEPREQASGTTVVECLVNTSHPPGETVVSRCDLDVILVSGSAPIAAAAKILLKSGKDSGVARDVAVVVGEDGAPIGILRRGGCLPSKHGARTLVRDAMEPTPLLLDARDSVERSAFEVARARVDLAVVVGWGGGVLGIARASELQRAGGQAYAPPPEPSP
ncbi:MAG: hypothetical protein U0414_22545 [Polyangiaceae bacterium]